MDSDVQPKLEELAEAVRNAYNEVDSALESGDEPRQLQTGDLVYDLDRRYRAFLDAHPEARQAIASRLERRLIDLKRAAAQLARRPAGQRAELAPDAGTLPFLELRPPPKSIVPTRAGAVDRPGVGDDVDAWCGKCKEIREHRIVALVADQPKQVVCNTCGSRHNYRTEPPKRAGVQVATPAARPAATTDQARMQRERDKAQLQKELASAEARPFDPKARYKAGEIIDHPDHGRGKIETVLRSSMLVRFAIGLRPVDLA